MPKLSGILSVFVLFLFAMVAHSQGKIVISAQAGNGAGSGSGVSQSSGNAQISVGVGGMIGFVGSAPGGVKGLPFSADVVEETDQYLADGNHIHRENHGKVFRDSEGRMRTENEIGSGIVGSKPFLHILINDPVQNTFILLNPENKAATVHHLMQRPVAASGSNSVPTNASPTQARTTASDPQSQALIQSLRDKRDQSMVRQHSREDLGTMEIEGFTVKGTRLTTTTPAGAMGNDKPMTTTSERWFSEDLKMELLTKSSSPESGQHVHRLVNIRSGDPDPLLFQVPVDYTVKEQQ